MNTLHLSSLLFGGFAGFSLLLSLVAFFMAFTRYLSSSKALCAQLEKLIKSNNYDRAAKLCMVAPPKTIMVRLCARSLKLAKELNPSLSPEERLSLLQRDLAAAPEQLQRETKNLQLLQTFSLVWLLGALFFASQLGESRQLGGAVIAAGLSLWYLVEHLERSTRLHEKSLLPSLLRALSAVAPAPVVIERPALQTAGALHFELYHKGERLPDLSFPKTQQVIKLGTLNNLQLKLPGENVSRMHAVIEVLADKVELIDLGSASGTFVNQQRITKAELRSGDTIAIGDCHLRYTREE